MVCFIIAAPFIDKLFYPFEYEDYIKVSAERYGVDPHLVAAVIHTESGFQSGAVSYRGARGLMQIMPATGEWAAGQLGYEDYDPALLFEPEYNIDLGTWYLSNLLDEFDQHEVVALAAYNGGRGEIRRWLEEGFWDGKEESVNNIPFSETRSFVKKTLRAFQKYKELYPDS